MLADGNGEGKPSASGSQGEPGPLRAISVMQPWAWLIVAGHKDIENRSWPTGYRGRVLIHAGKKTDPDYRDADAWEWPDIPRPDVFDHGGIVGEVEITGCVTASASRWFVGPYGFMLRNARILPFRPCRGKLSFFTPDYSPTGAPAGEQGAAPRQGSMF